MLVLVHIRTGAFARGNNPPSRKIPSRGPAAAPVKLNDACKI